MPECIGRWEKKSQIPIERPEEGEKGRRGGKKSADFREGISF